jgi:phosphate transport system substrate-binding protein
MRGARQLAFVALLLTGLLLGVGAASSTRSPRDAKNPTLAGAGSTFVFPLVSRWAQEYRKTSGVTISYDPIGSGGGVDAIVHHTVDFGASDAPLTATAAKAGGVLQVPWALSATAIVYNLPGTQQALHLTAQVIADVYRGTVTKWTDPAIKALNPSQPLPDVSIIPIYRGDKSGTTYTFTEFLSKSVPAWQASPGAGTAVAFPTGYAAQRGAGMVAAVRGTLGAIGYVDIADAVANRLPYAALENGAGIFQRPTLQSIAAAAALTKLPASNAVSLVAPPSSRPNAYPIATFTYVIVSAKSAKALVLQRFLSWVLNVGQQYGPALLFVPLSGAVLARSKQTVARLAPTS